MKIFTEEEVAQRLASAKFCTSEDDGHGQVVIYTGLFLWKDGSYRDSPDPHYEEDRYVD